MLNYRFLSTALLAVATVAGCGSVPENSRLNEARTDYNAAQNTPRVTNLAPTELKQAKDALDKANNASAKNKDEAEVTNLAYLAKQRVAIAQETARQKEAEAAVTSANVERGNIRLDARTEEANKAQRKAEASTRQAEAAQRRAEASQQQAQASQQQAAMSQHQADMSLQQARDAELRANQLEAQLNELSAKKTERGLVITLGDVLFDTNQAQLKSGGTRSLQKLAGFLKQYPQRNAQVEGYTDSTGSADYNQELSDRRANAVRTSLVGMGISSDRITTRGYGKEPPVASNDTASGRQMNRRVEIILSDNIGNVSSR
jgi:outer membrane protein OmpA-like peptidoglycan-associated protein